MSTFKATIVSTIEELKNKSNGGQTQLCQALITDGPLKGLTVLAQRTVKNAAGAAKPLVKANDDVTLHHSQLPSTTKPGTMTNFFEVSLGMGASQDDINALLAVANAAVATSASTGVPF